MVRWMLTDRQLFILQAIIDDYIRSAQPVGSRTISKRQDVTYSSATIRNEMADLEEMGFLEKPHSSAGRIPSEKGYRFYVDHLVSPSVLNQNDLHNIRELFTEKMLEFEQVIEQSAKILSDLTNYTTIILGPEIFNTNLKQLQLIPISDTRVVAVFVTDTGYVENKVFTLPKEMNEGDIEKFSNILNERLKNAPLYKLRKLIHTEVSNVLHEHIRNFEALIQIFDELLQVPVTDKVYYGGKVNMLTQPEFHDVNTLRTLLDTIETQDFIQYLSDLQAKDMKVRIGQENTFHGMEHCSLITASYSVHDKHIGSISIVGPTRMQYGRVISLIELLSRDLTKMFHKWYHD